MRQSLPWFTLLFVLLAVILYLFREPLGELADDIMLANMFVLSDADDFDPGPALGSHFPGVQATHQGEDIKLISQFAGDKGTVLVASRSLEWCSYCKRQMVQLQTYREAFEDAGIGVVAITYDDPKLLDTFAQQHGITIPLLSDVKALSFKTLGILNDAHKPGDEHFGLPYPGMIVIDPAGRVVGKLFLESYRIRVDSGAALAFARSALGLD